MLGNPWIAGAFSVVAVDPDPRALSLFVRRRVGGCPKEARGRLDCLSLMPERARCSTPLRVREVPTALRSCRLLAE